MKEYDKIKKRINAISLKNVDPNFNAKEEIIITLRFGIGQNKDYSVDEIASILNITPLEVIAVSKMFLSNYKDELNELLNKNEENVKESKIRVKKVSN